MAVIHHGHIRLGVFKSFVIGTVVVVVTVLLYGWSYYDSPGPLTDEATVIFKKGEGFQQIVDDMASAGVITQPWLFKAFAAINGDGRKFKAGEYKFTAAISPRLVMDMIAEGRVVVHKFTVPEGWTVRDVVALLNNEKALEGDIAPDVKEGSLLPETYHFTYGDQRQEIIQRMQTGMASMLAGLWANRKEGLPFKTPSEALTMASIVEKETGVPGERGHVASVFINRLRKGMKLQSDPTVTYGIEQKSGAKLTRSLTLDDLHQSTPYNTYVIAGLPPAPIANPGRTALEATLNPPDTKDLYFVATGTGGHNFSPTLAGHNKNVQSYRETMAKKPQP